MRISIAYPLIVSLGLSAGTGPALAAPAAPAVTAQREDAETEVLKAQVLLDRAGFSPGVIDGWDGESFKKALAAFQHQNGLPETGNLDSATLAALTAKSPEPILTEYEVTASDVAGPFAQSIPESLEDQAKLPNLDYTSPGEALAERFHMDRRLLAALNPHADFSQAGARIMVANVEHRNAKPPVERVVVDKTQRSVSAFDSAGNLVAFYPATIGSEEKPAPTGTFKVKGVQKNPIYHYDPKFAFKDVKVQQKFDIQPGPNSPVGLVWIALSAPSYGIHGTAMPEKISKTESHGCVRLTNWDALDLAALVHPGTVVEFQG